MRHHSLSYTISSDLKREFTNFLQFFEESNPTGTELKYVKLIHRMLDDDKHILIVGHQDLISYNSDLANTVFDEFYRHQQTLNNALTHLVREHEKNIMGTDNDLKRDDEKQDFYEISFDSALNANDDASVRDLKCDKLGKLICFKGTITRTSEVRPQLSVGIFKCKNCGTFSKPIEQQFKYTHPKSCIEKNCTNSIWQLDISQSKFSDFQKLRVQQDPTKIPPGAMPRSIDIIVRNEMVETGQPGDKCRFIGYLCVSPEIISMLKLGENTQISSMTHENRGQMQIEGVTGIKGMRELNYKLIFTSVNLIVQNNQFREEPNIEIEQDLNNVDQEDSQRPNYNQQLILGKIFNKLTENEIYLIKQFKENPNVYEDMANSLFPSVFGHLDIKKALLLQLFGGVHKVTGNKMSIRGDINVLIVGDPSTAKSQFLKVINKFVPRSVYTNGKTTSAAGLTASVTRDESGNVGIEAGALMLADNGICCIDEFDKMNISDQVAIHEAMQQQTISIAKAGVYATLNARTSILAAANPIFGRYDKSKSLKYNINISAPIMSRFDLFFVLCDQVNQLADAHLSSFLINMHRYRDNPSLTVYDSKSLKLFLSTAKRLKPMLTREAAQLLQKYYIQLRLQDVISENNSYKVTVRQLESMIRISEALARLHLDIEVKAEYVREAYHLISSSIIKLEKSPIALTEEEIFEQAENNEQRHRTDLVMAKELENKKQWKKNKQVMISHELYQEIQRNVVELFKKQTELQAKDREEIKITQQTLVVYLLGLNFEAGMVNTEQESLQMKKIIAAVIKKLIKQQRILMIAQQNTDVNKQELRIHPNYMF